jgi:hypothetical protein
MTPIQVQILSKAGAYLRRRATVLGAALMRGGAAFGIKTEIIDGFIVRAARRGRRAVAMVMDTPAVISFSGITGADNSSYLLVPSVGDPHGRDLASTPPAEAFDPEPRLLSISRWGGYYLVLDGGATDPGLNSLRTYNWISPLYASGFGSEWLQITQFFIAMAGTPTGTAYLVEIRLIMPAAKSRQLVPIEGHPEYYEYANPDEALSELPESMHVLRYHADYFARYVGAYSVTFGGSFLATVSPPLPSLCVVSRSSEHMRYLATVIFTKYTIPLDFDGPDYDYGVACVALELVDLRYDEEGLLDTADSQNVLFIDPTTLANEWSRPEEAIGLPGYFQPNTLAARSAIISNGGQQYVVCLVNSLCNKFVPETGHASERFYSLFAVVKPLTAGAAATRFLFAPEADDYDSDHLSTLQAALMGVVVLGMDSDGVTAVAVTGTAQLLTYPFILTEVAPYPFGIVVCTAAAATLTVHTINALPFMGSPASDAVTYIGNGKFIFFVTTSMIEIHAGTPLSDYVFNFALAQYDLNTLTVTVIGEIHAGMTFKNGTDELDLRGTNPIAPGRVSVIQQEIANEAGTITQAAVLLASVGTHNGRMRNNGVTKISHDSGATWKVIANLGARFGATLTGGATWPPKAHHLLEA